MALAVKIHISLQAQVGLLAGDVQRVKSDAPVGQRGMDGALALKVHTNESDGELLQARIAA